MRHQSTRRTVKSCLHQSIRRTDRESMSKPDFLHAAVPPLYPEPDKLGRYRSGCNSETRGGCVRSARGFIGLVYEAGPGVAASLPSASASADAPGRIGGKVAFVPGPPFVPGSFTPSTFTSSSLIKQKKIPASPPVRPNTTPHDPFDRTNYSNGEGKKGGGGEKSENGMRAKKTLPDLLLRLSSVLR